MTSRFNKFLLTGTALVAVSMFSTQALATEIVDPGPLSVTATDATGLINAVDNSTVGETTTVTIDSDAGAITLGADATAAINNSVAGDTIAVVVDETNDNNNGVIFAGDITNTGTNVTVSVVDDNATFQGNVNSSTLTAGDSAGGTVTLTFDNANAENLTHGTAIDAAAAGDTINIAINNSNGGANTQTFSAAIGTSAVDDITLGANADATFNGAVTTTDFKMSAASSQATLGALLTGNVTMGGGTLVIAASGAVTGTIDGAGTLDVNESGTVTGVIGGSTALTTIDVAAGKTLTTTENVTATTVNLAGASSKITLAGGKNLTAAVTAGVAGEGIVEITDAAATTVITGDLGASGTNIDALTILDGGTLANVVQTGDDLYVDTVTIGANDTLELNGSAAQNVAGAVANAGTVTVSNTSATVAFGGAVTGAGTVNVNASTSTFAGAVTADVNVTTGSADFSGAVTGTVDIGTGDATFGAASASGNVTFSGAGTANADAQIGTVAFGANAATVNVAAGITIGNITGSAGTVEVADGATIGSVSAIDGLTLSGTNGSVSSGAITTPTALTLGTNQLDAGANAVDLTGSNINVTLDDITANSGDVVTTGVLTITAATTMTITAGTLTDGGVYTVLVGGAGSSIVDNFTIVDPSGWTFAADIATANTLKLVATQTATSTAAGDVNMDNVATGITAGGAGGTADVEITALETAITAAGTEAAKDELRESAIATVDGSAVVSMMDVGATAQAITDVRMASVRSDEMTGMAAGSSMWDRNFWMQAYGSVTDQDARDGVDGYESDVYGVAFGADKQTKGGATVGVAVNFGKVDSDSENANRTNTDITSYGVNLYGSVDITRDAFLTGQVGYAYNDVEITRYDVGGVPAQTANGDTSSDQYSAKLALGRDYQVGNAVLTPSVFAAYTHLATDGYTETGTCGGLCLTVSEYDVDALNVGAGLNTSWELSDGEGAVTKPYVSVQYAYDTVGDAVELTSTFAGAPAAAFATKGAEPARDIFNVGTGFVYESSADWDISADYGYTYKEDYGRHSGSLKATFHF